MSVESKSERLDALCALAGPPLERLWHAGEQPILRMVTSVTDDEMQSRFAGSERLLGLVRSWDRSATPGVTPEIDAALADRETRVDFERLTVLIRRRNDPRGR
jgi:hypothetical protein